MLDVCTCPVKGHQIVTHMHAISLSFCAFKAHDSSSYRFPLSRQGGLEQKPVVCSALPGPSQCVGPLALETHGSITPASIRVYERERARLEKSPRRVSRWSRQSVAHPLQRWQLLPLKAVHAFPPLRVALSY